MGLAVCALLMMQGQVIAAVPLQQSTAIRHRHDSQKVQCMKRLMGSNRKIFYVDAARMCESPALSRRAPGPTAPMVATTTPPTS